MLCQELDIAGLELQYWVAQYFGVLKDVKIERTVDIGVLTFVPFKGHYTKLESVHTSAVVPQFLVAIFNLIKAVDLVFVTHIET